MGLPTKWQIVAIPMPKNSYSVTPMDDAMLTRMLVSPYHLMQKFGQVGSWIQVDRGHCICLKLSRIDWIENDPERSSSFRADWGHHWFKERNWYGCQSRQRCTGWHHCFCIHQFRKWWINRTMILWIFSTQRHPRIGKEIRTFHLQRWRKTSGSHLRSLCTTFPPHRIWQIQTQRYSPEEFSFYFKRKYPMIYGPASCWTWVQFIKRRSEDF